MIFKRDAYNELLNWKEKYTGKYVALIEGARRVGKTTLVENFAKNEYKSYIKIDFNNAPKRILDLFDDLFDLDYFFFSLQTIAKVKLYERQSVIIFDEIQLFPKARQALKVLLEDGRYDYIETGSLISIKKNVKNILIPSEEYRINLYPMNFKEFCLATNILDYNNLRELYKLNRSVGESLNKDIMKKFRIYLAVGGMPQAVQSYINKSTFFEIDLIKKRILELYDDDFNKIDNSGYISLIYNNIPAQLQANKKRFVISKATNRKISQADCRRLSELIDSKTILPCYGISDPSFALSASAKLSEFKLYLSDVGLYTTILFHQKGFTDIYERLISNSLNINVGYLYENVVAQIIKSFNQELYYYSWQKENSTHHYEIDFFIPSNNKIIPLEIKSGQTKPHNSIDAFNIKYSNRIKQSIVLSQYDVKHEGQLLFKPIYFLPFIIEDALSTD